MRWYWILLGSAAMLVIVVFLVGALLPRAHSVTRKTILHQPPKVVWDALTDLAAFPSWRPEVKSVERLPDREGRAVWREDTSFGKITFEIAEARPPGLLIVRIADPDLPFGGTWTYRLAATEEGTALTVTEDGEVRNPLYRFLSRFVFGYASSVEQCLKSLGRKFGEQVRIDE